MSISFELMLVSKVYVTLMRLAQLSATYLPHAFAPRRSA